MATNPQNLKPIDSHGPERAREIRQMGARAKNEKARRNRDRGPEEGVPPGERRVERMETAQEEDPDVIRLTVRVQFDILRETRDGMMPERRVQKPEGQQRRRRAERKKGEPAAPFPPEEEPEGVAKKEERAGELHGGGQAEKETPDEPGEGPPPVTREERPGQERARDERGVAERDQRMSEDAGERENRKEREKRRRTRKLPPDAAEDRAQRAGPEEDRAEPVGALSGKEAVSAGEMKPR